MDKEVTLELELAEPLTEEQKNAILGQKPGRPALMKLAAPIYEHECSKYPDMIRVSFIDGHTEVYELRVRQPHPLVIKNIEIMRETKKKITQGYVNQPETRRRRK